MNPAFLDTNVFIYAVGTAHPLKEPSTRVLLLVAAHSETFATSAEVFQEILHRALATGRWPQTRPHLHGFMALMSGRVHTVTPSDVEAAAALADIHRAITARDLLHAAVMQRAAMTHIVSADRGFDRIDGIIRLDPMLVDEWQSLVTGG